MTRSERQLKVGFVFDDTLDNPDGVQQYMLTLGQWLEDNDHEVRYLVGETHSRIHDPTVYSLSKNVKVRFNHNRMSVPLVANKKFITSVLDKEQFDALHVQLPCSPLLSGRIVAMADPATSIVGTFHVVGSTRLEEVGAKLLSKLQTKMFERIDHLVSVSKAADAFASRNFGVKTQVIPLPIDYKRFSAAKKMPYLMDGKTNIIFLGRLVERKGVKYLIEATKRLNERNKTENLRVIICGGGPLESELREMVRRYHLTHLIQFVGYVSEEDKMSYLASSHLTIYPSVSGESFGIVILEAMAAGSGVVMGGDNQGYRTVLGPQANHVLFNPRNSVEFADKIEILLSTPELRAKIHKWQESEVLKYDVNRVGKELLELYIRK
ncbi:MAG TPA: glycosyltransferase family 4 protein [Candidatus Saccharimonadales bacterium]|nr:glycosyltransferase family 4 protein [Candidatus Saccharimonadales bacterium]